MLVLSGDLALSGGQHTLTFPGVEVQEKDSLIKRDTSAGRLWRTGVKYRELLCNSLT